MVHNRKLMQIKNYFEDDESKLETDKNLLFFV